LEKAKTGDSESLFEIGETYFNNMDFNKAFIWFQKSAARNNYEAQNRLGELYYQGRGVTKDYELAYEWFVKTSEGKNIKAFRNIGLMHRRGHGKPQNNGWALHFYFQAVENGDIESMLDIGDIYCGWSAWKLALIWYKRAADKGHKRARKQEKKMYAKNVYLDYNEHGIVSLISFSTVSTN
jgi:TPR repeat protein